MPGPEKHPDAVHFDLVIVGGGMVGASLALGLRGSGYRVAVVEPVVQGDVQQPSFDDRCLALSLGSVRIMQALGLWKALAADATPIRNILVCERGQFGMHRLSAVGRGLEFLGQVVAARDCGRHFWQALATQPDTGLMQGYRLQQMQRGDTHWALTLAPTIPTSSARPRHTPGGGLRRITCQAVVAADGAHSTVCELLEIESQQTHYDQAAIIANIQTTQPHTGSALERFTRTGPLALLPLADRWSLVWSVPREQQAPILALNDAAFAAALQSQLGYRMGRITRVGQRIGYPLALITRDTIARAGLFILGNASHNIHPIAGQGFNLGLRDAAWLIEHLRHARAQGLATDSAELAQRYQASRRADIQRTVTATDTLARLFTNHNSALIFGRNLALASIGWSTQAADWLAQTAMGLHHPVPRLACGLSLEDFQREVEICDVL